MMKTLKSLFVVLLLPLVTSCSEHKYPDNANLSVEDVVVRPPVAKSPKVIIPAADSSPLFVGVNIAKLKEPDKTAVSQAITDFDRVKNGLPPTCKAEPDISVSDDGTAIYKCKHYQLMVMKSIYQVGDNSGYIYGPIITFPGDYPISDVRFYTTTELQALLGRNGL
jgi:hypothetical protein